jgi:hypothetical protein
MKFKIEQLALNPLHPGIAFGLMDALGLTDWSHDQASAKGPVHGQPATEEGNVASLSFNHETPGLELEIINYRSGDNWLEKHNTHASVASHIGMHCSAEELERWRAKFTALGIKVAQEVVTTKHTNPNVPEGRRYKYVIFDTRDIIGLDVKFIVRL